MKTLLFLFALCAIGSSAQPAVIKKLQGIWSVQTSDKRDYVRSETVSVKLEATPDTLIFYVEDELGNYIKGTTIPYDSLELGPKGFRQKHVSVDTSNYDSSVTQTDATWTFSEISGSTWKAILTSTTRTMEGEYKYGSNTYMRATRRKR